MVKCRDVETCLHDCTVCYLTVKSCCRLYGNFSIYCNLFGAIGQRSPSVLEDEQTFDPPESEKSHEITAIANPNSELVAFSFFISVLGLILC